MSRHDDVSCDSCMEASFSGKRFKCLICYDYDLCANCFERGAMSGNHASDHPMQCLLAPNDLDLYYGSDGARHIQSFTCPLCGSMGFSVSSLRDHVLADHAFDAAREVLCPICVAMTANTASLYQNRFTDEFPYHIEHEHRTEEESNRPRTESDSSSVELRNVMVARRGTGRLNNRSSRGL